MPDVPIDRFGEPTVFVPQRRQPGAVNRFLRPYRLQAQLVEAAVHVDHRTLGTAEVATDQRRRRAVQLQGVAGHRARQHFFLRLDSFLCLTVSCSFAVIRSWRNAASEKVWQGERPNRFRGLDFDGAVDLLLALNVAQMLRDLSPLAVRSPTPISSSWTGGRQRTVHRRSRTACGCYSRSRLKPPSTSTTVPWEKPKSPLTSAATARPTSVSYTHLTLPTKRIV